ncbi:hypothetical protein MKW98_010818 [Papaver atlanticum]|uniref:Uncharacterized protein n=1 Tax=Papaver atlanticum TaxID=357466 RepID=A0AAD4SNE8_9MAGN|nr:hypothetical protein MKW98_010818 [Papaver atlanticum]
MRHQNGTGTPTDLHSAESKVSMNVENKKMSLIFVMACFIGITSGFLIGYMTGIIGELMFSTGFMNHLYPSDEAFTYDDIVMYSMVFSFFPAILYFSGSIGIDIRKRDFSRLDMRRHMILSGALVSIGSVVTIFNAVPIIFILGPNSFAMGFGIMYQGAQVYMCEMGFAHRNYLASLNFAFKMMIAIGGWGWEVSIGIAALLGAIISIGSFLLPYTPMSMIKLAFPLFQQLTGMNVIVIYSPYLLQAIRFQESATLTYTAVLGGVNVAATIIGIISVSRGCRRVFLIAGGVQICVGQIMLGILIWIKLGGATGTSDVYDYIIIATTCICVSGFAWSRGPLGWIFLSSHDDMSLLYPLKNNDQTKKKKKEKKKKKT